jgi:hypothetical protein
MAQAQRQRGSAIEHKMLRYLGQFRPEPLLSGRQGPQVGFERRHLGLNTASRQWWNPAAKSLVPIRPGFNVEDTGWRTIKNLQKCGISQKSQRSADIV